MSSSEEISSDKTEDIPPSTSIDLGTVFPKKKIGRDKDEDEEDSSKGKAKEKKKKRREPKKKESRES
jgi:hypothetical protein